MEDFREEDDPALSLQAHWCGRTKKDEEYYEIKGNLFPEEIYNGKVIKNNMSVDGSNK